MSEPMPSMRQVDPDVVRGEAVPTPRERALRIGWWALGAVALGTAYLVGWVVFDDVARIPAWYWVLWLAAAGGVAVLVEARTPRR
ncbi:hypothetical protein [Xylanimonas protaetiae]|uniref:DUF2530 domain-containing protein n=1 Tax=Xylanimonas protaetiae TaxID=2509457 RepID=A0A4P6F519_9MICO|nr:hypothetical protein [Xylanimonas protaetiae]QAY69843.1 hypothetical protein ET471_07150 [Xylanimonas protaetiae]